MADYATILVVLPMVLSMATTAHCNWISRGAPTPVKAGDHLTLGDNLLDIPAPINEHGPNDDSDPDADNVVPGPGDESTVPADNGGKFIVQEKEANDDLFIIQGKVYCDPCRIQIPTKISYPLAGTKISLACHKADTHEETYRAEGASDEKGKYKLEAAGDHAEEICEIIVTESPDPNCPELMDDENHVRISLTNKHGLKGKGRYANPLGFMTSNADPRCKEALDELGFTRI